METHEGHGHDAETNVVSGGGDPVDPVTVEIVKGALRSAQGEMEMLLERTAMSPIIREKQDYFCGIFDRHARLLIGTKIPVLGNILSPILETYGVDDMRPGDLYWYNDCYGSKGGVSHSPDQVFVAPVFVDDELVGYAHSWAHFLDIGGMRAGSTTPDATEIFQEGIIVPPVRLYREGVLNEELLRVFTRNSRFPDMARGDVRASVAAVRLAERRIEELFERFSAATLQAAFDRLIRQTEEAVRAGFREIFGTGHFKFADRLDTDGHGTGPITVRLSLSSNENGISLDTTDSDDQVRGPVNFLMHPSVPKMIFGIYLLSKDPSLVLNEGVFQALDEVKTREGSIVQPIFPAALGLRTNTLARVQSSCFGLIDIANPAHAHASSSIYSFNHVNGTDSRTGKPFLKSMGVAVGHGARPHADGIDAVYYVAQKNYPVEFVEQNYPLRVRRYGINRDSGGPGRWRGGTGVVRELEVITDEAVVAVRMDNVDCPPWGVNGGMAGRSGRFILNPGKSDEKRLNALEEGVKMRRGDVLQIETVGGGGCGHPFDREPERVLRDVLGGFVTPESAHRDYGVVLNEDCESVDAAATEAYRREQRWDVKMFHRGAYFDADEWYAEHASA
ncbi:MAG: hydantoinase B/oxoprolinase family protein [Alphaproteobacteria bacterium]|nr:hydantoinase B/oxoprolinase family protein [Alphaproteobacteria bacterium]